MKTPDTGVKPVPHQAQKTASEGTILVFGATEEPPSGLLQLLFIQSQKENSATFACTKFSEVACPSAPAGAAALPLLPYAS
jgi:hypothetical protein